MLNIGLLGAGRIGQVHAKAITAHPGSRLVAVSDVNAEAAAKLAAEYGAEARDTQAILADPAIEAVLIATSTDTHSDLIEAATAAGKAVLCEKPVDLSLARAQACQRAVAGSGRPVMIGFNRRFDPNFTALKASADAGEIGKPELLSITSFDPAPPPVSYIKVSGGLFRDMMIHDFDTACWLMGGTPESVSATGTSIVDPAIGAAGDVDTAVVTLRYADGRIAVIKNSRRAVYGYDQRVELLGSEGLLSAGNVIENTVTKATTSGVVAAKPEFFFLERYMRAYAAEWAAFVAGLEGGAAVPVTLDDGVNALALAEAAARSLELGRSVALAEIGGASAQKVATVLA
ncbi:inositol 2-dehydrogenase [Amaricoccus solimangrovi]|uniref:Inositol 2-dehydrogenase n=1 Tax=Amaricoccus solimangrovi TaxID=2589815 RepID=A0A501WE39_9RHOB|nr:inositol 2-dehydrogenase [Amaricoccus solimangrovi]TPE43786.1 inositol 2-dehydrogenase [Amaricoccus solimangrovi]